MGVVKQGARAAGSVRASSLQMPAWNFMAMTEPLWLLYCLVQSPNSVTQHLADPSADPLYMSRFTTKMQITAFVCPSIVW